MIPPFFFHRNLRGGDNVRLEGFHAPIVQNRPAEFNPFPGPAEKEKDRFTRSCYQGKKLSRSSATVTIRINSPQISTPISLRLLSSSRYLFLRHTHATKQDDEKTAHLSAVQKRRQRTIPCLLLSPSVSLQITDRPGRQDWRRRCSPLQSGRLQASSLPRPGRYNRFRSAPSRSG